MSRKLKVRKPRRQHRLRKPLSLLYPERCPYCSKIIEADALACPDCEQELLSHLELIMRGILGCRCVSAFRYEEKPRKAVLALKYYQKFPYARQLAAVMHRCVKAAFFGIDFDVILFVPMHRSEQRTREFNQSRMLATELSDLMGVPCADALKKTKRTPKQQGLSATQRRQNLIGAFRLKDESFLSGKNVLVVDDVVTTGATLFEIAKVITKARPNRICFATFCNASLDEKTPEPLDEFAGHD